MLALMALLSGCSTLPAPAPFPTPAEPQPHAAAGSPAPRMFTTRVMLHGEPLELHMAAPEQAQGQAQTPAEATVPATIVLYASGDGGWFGAAVDMFKRMAEAGYPVVGFSSKAFLKIQRPHGRLVNAAQLAADYESIVTQARAALHQDESSRVIFTGWSRGAAFSVLAGSEPATRDHLAGVIAIGLGPGEDLATASDDEGDAGSAGDADDTASDDGQPSEPGRRWPFDTYATIARLAPVACAVIQASHDNYLPAADARRLFGPDTDRRRLYAIDAQQSSIHGRQGGVRRRAARRAALDYLRGTHDTPVAVTSRYGPRPSSRSRSRSPPATERARPVLVRPGRAGPHEGNVDDSRPRAVAAPVRHARQSAHHRVERRRRLDPPRPARRRSPRRARLLRRRLRRQGLPGGIHFRSDHAARRGRAGRLQGARGLRRARREPQADPDRRVGRRRPVGARGDRSADQDVDRRRDRPRPARSQRAGLALAGLADLHHARHAERADVQHRGDRRSASAPRRSARSTRRATSSWRWRKCRRSSTPRTSRSGCGSSRRPITASATTCRSSIGACSKRSTGSGRTPRGEVSRARTIASVPSRSSSGLLLFVAALEVLRLELRAVTWHELTADVARTPVAQLALALGAHRAQLHGAHRLRPARVRLHRQAPSPPPHRVRVVSRLRHVEQRRLRDALRRVGALSLLHAMGRDRRGAVADRRVVLGDVLARPARPRRPEPRDQSAARGAANCPRTKC